METKGTRRRVKVKGKKKKKTEKERKKTNVMIKIMEKLTDEATNNGQQRDSMEEVKGIAPRTGYQYPQVIKQRARGGAQGGKRSSYVDEKINNFFYDANPLMSMKASSCKRP